MRLPRRSNNEAGINPQDDEYMALLPGKSGLDMSSSEDILDEQNNHQGRAFKLEGFTGRALDMPQADVVIGMHRYLGAVGVSLGLVSGYMHSKGVPAQDLFESAALGGVSFGGIGHVMLYPMERLPGLWMNLSEKADFEQRKTADNNVVRTGWLNIFTPISSEVKRDL